MLLQLQRAATRLKPLSNKDRGKTLIGRIELNTNPLTGPSYQPSVPPPLCQALHILDRITAAERIGFDVLVRWEDDVVPGQHLQGRASTWTHHVIKTHSLSIQSSVLIVQSSGPIDKYRYSVIPCPSLSVLCLCTKDPELADIIHFDGAQALHPTELVLSKKGARVCRSPSATCFFQLNVKLPIPFITCRNVSKSVQC